MISNLHYRYLQTMPENTGYVDIHDSLYFSFSMAKEGTHYWNRIQYQTSDGSWADWGGVYSIVPRLESDGRYHIKLRGIGNTRLTSNLVDGYIVSNAFSCSSHENGDLRISGNIENLLDYSTVARGNHCTLDTYGLSGAFSSWKYLRYVDPWFLPLPSIPKSGCNAMFASCSNLIIGPEIPATTIGDLGCESMFGGCHRLKKAMTFCNAVSLGKGAFRGMHKPLSGDLRCDLEVAPAILPATTLSEQCYLEMYMGCNKLKHCPRLPATTLGIYCCHSMFRNCTSLTAAPELPATTLANFCYNQMFSGCTSLTAAPKLSATTLASDCCYQMFKDCTSLTTAPALPATTLAKNCYAQMFYNCSSLTTIPELPATTLASYCYGNMFEKCKSIKLSQSRVGEYQTPYRIPKTGTGTTASSALSSMFKDTGGTFTGTPTIDTTYYTSNTIV